jgi:predicted peptidase
MVPLRGLFYLGLMIGIISLFPSRARLDDQLFQDRVIKIGSNEYHFKVFVPKNWTKKKKTPVILFLHGAGERGDDNLAQTKVGIGPAIVREQANLPFIIVLPQCPKNRWWTEPEMQDMALKAFDQTVKEFKGDKSRLYLTGLSMGGYGSWLLAANNPTKFSAVAVVCGGVRPPGGLKIPNEPKWLTSSSDPYAEVATKVSKLPLWVFHGDADLAVPVSESQKMVKALKALGANVRYNEYPGVGHNSWDKAYAEPELFTWFASARRK